MRKKQCQKTKHPLDNKTNMQNNHRIDELPREKTSKIYRYMSLSMNPRDNSTDIGILVSCISAC